LKEESLFKKIWLWIGRLFSGGDKYAGLRHYTLFKDLNSHELGLVFDLLHPRDYRTGETIFEKGFPLEAIFFIESGEVEASEIQPGSGARILKRHQFIGVLDLFAQNKRLSTATALTDVAALALSESDFWDLVNKFPALGVKILRACCRFQAKFMFGQAPEHKA